MLVAHKLGRKIVGKTGPKSRIFPVDQLDVVLLPPVCLRPVSFSLSNKSFYWVSYKSFKFCTSSAVKEERKTIEFCQPSLTFWNTIITLNTPLSHLNIFFLIDRIVYLKENTKVLISKLKQRFYWHWQVLLLLRWQVTLEWMTDFLDISDT